MTAETADVKSPPGRNNPFALLQKKDPYRYHYHLWFKFFIVNTLFVVFTAISFLNGWIGEVFAKKATTSWAETLFTFHPQTTFVAVMAVVFLVGWMLSAYRTFLTSREINSVKQGAKPHPLSRAAACLVEVSRLPADRRDTISESYFKQWRSRTGNLRAFSSFLVWMGLLGTVIGFVLVLKGVKPQAGSDAHAITNIVEMLIYGMGVALYTTVVGSVTALWLTANYYILKNGSADFEALLTRRIEQRVVAHSMEISETSVDPPADLDREGR